jgi:hypothetical protein
MTQHFDSNQTGFVAGIGNSLNLLMLVERLLNIMKREGGCCILVDYKSPYNTVNRKRLYGIMKRKHILADDEVDFLESLHQALYLRCGDKRFYFKNGVYQGSPISFALFKIYIEEVITELN